MLKKLVTGQFSLPMTFWGWGFCGGMLIGLIGMAGIHAGIKALVPLAYILKVILFSSVLSGLTFILRRKITVFGVLGFLVALIQIIACAVMAVGLRPLLFE